MPIPASADLIGLVLHHQFLAFGSGGGVNIVAATRTSMPNTRVVKSAHDARDDQALAP